MMLRHCSSEPIASTWFSVIVICALLSAPKLKAAGGCSSAFGAVQVASAVSAVGAASAASADAHARRQAKEYVQNWIELQTQNLAPNELSERLAEAQRLFDRIRQNNPNFAKYVQDEFERARVQMSQTAQVRRPVDRRNDLESKIRILKSELKEFESQSGDLGRWRVEMSSKEGPEQRATLLDLYQSGLRRKSNGTELQIMDTQFIVVSQKPSVVLFDGLAKGLGHKDFLIGARISANKKILSWGGDHYLVLWSNETGTYLPEQTLGDPDDVNFEKGHTSAVLGGLFLQDGRILSWSTDLKLGLWQSVNGRYVFEQRFDRKSALKTDHVHRFPLANAVQLADGSILSVDEMGHLIRSSYIVPDSIRSEADRLQAAIRALQTELSILIKLESKDDEKNL